MSRPLKEGGNAAGWPGLRGVWTLAILFSLPAYLGAIYNPDLFWHLSAGRWIIEHHAVPRTDWLSFTRPGTPWVDFEWLSQLVFELIHKAAGFYGLWLLKALLLLATWLGLNAVMKLRGLDPFTRAAGLLLWSTAAMMSADIRPELFSLAGAAATFYLLETVWAGKARFTAWLAGGVLALFALWSNLHAGFPLGLGLIALYALESFVRGRDASAFGKLFAAALIGTLINPYGAGIYGVIWRHAQEGAQLGRFIAEWQPLSARKPAYWGVWLLLFGFAAAALRLPRRLTEGSALSPWLAAAAVGLAMLSHERAGSYFHLGAVVCVCAAAAAERWGRKVLSAAAATCVIFALWLAPQMRRPPFDYRFVPRVAAEFISDEQAVFKTLRVYNPWEWGGYLGWRLSAWCKVFDDGRYIFHDELPREWAAVNDPDPRKWQDYLGGRGIDALLLENMPKTFSGTRSYRDGTQKTFARPYYLFFAPPPDWALVHWDESALVFVRRKSAPNDWLARHEYRYLRPHDGPALADALSRGEIAKSAVDAEAMRYQEEMRLLTKGL